ncbi:MAG: 1-acyl-sn-glycerol-3-phosphate acyltransferase [Candidatus Symbiothrix sp.]|jgi:1-acyl-sn-glycerol-3-phosphate acyltransferase|nr:1-acyl-sn-glycerol-3-phosphate acyltransferase [Candidatus Symbiothrix sp.]
MDTEALKRQFYHSGFWYQILKIFIVTPAFFRFYRRVKVLGKQNIPRKGPFIYAITHQNSLMDALAVLCTQWSQPLFVARADIFENKTVVKILHFLRILPIFRQRDKGKFENQNDQVFDILVSVLVHKKVVGIMPEGVFNPTKMLAPLQKGIFRIAMPAVEEMQKNGLPVDLKIVPVGVNWEDPKSFYKNITVCYGEPMQTADYYAGYKENQAATLKQMTNELTARMRATQIEYTETILPKKTLSLTEKISNLLFILLLLLLLPIAAVGLLIGIIPYLLSLRLQNLIRDPQFKMSLRYVITLLADVLVHIALFTLSFIFLYNNWLLLIGAFILILFFEKIWYEWMARYSQIITTFASQNTKE